MTRFECFAQEQVWYFPPFLLGIVIFTLLVAKHNKLGLKEALLATVGMRKFGRTVLINLVHAGSIAIPLVLVLWRISSCDPTLFGG